MDGEAAAAAAACRDLHLDVSAFIDAFVDFSVSGIFFPNRRPSPPPKTRHLPPDRLVAIGDLHGDLSKCIQALVLAGLIDPVSRRWIAGTAVAVQVGDVLDRGADEINLIYFLHRLKQDAAGCGGALITMIGNHEIMNVQSDFRYVDRSSLVHFENWARWSEIGTRMKHHCLGLGIQPNIFRSIPNRLPGIRAEFQEGFRARIAALRPDGPISRRFLSDNPTILVIGEYVFVHGGLLKTHVSYGLERINEEVSHWIKGFSGKLPPDSVRGRNSVVWLRRFSDESEVKCDCDLLEHVLATIPGARRMIMGHTVQQKGINGICGNRAIRIDVGLSKGCGNGLPEVLEFNGHSKEMRILSRRATRSSGCLFESGSTEGAGGLFQEDGPKQVEVQA